MSRARDPGACVLLFFLCFFALLSSGRIASSDAGHQLQASVMLALTGRLGDDGLSGGPGNEAWVRAPNGRLYQAHDIGNIVLMLPAAWVGSQLSAAPAVEDIRNPPALSRVAVSLTCAALSAVGCFWLFRLFALYWDVTPAFLLALAFPSTTIFLAYSRAAWDVLGGCVCMCGVLYYSASLLRPSTSLRTSLVLLAATLAAACSFRFSLAPFIVPAAAFVVFFARRSLQPRVVAGGALVFAIVMLPSFAYNFVRTGSPLRPATATAQYLQGNNALTGSVLDGFYGLWLSPNRGLFLFSPILLLAFATPFFRHRLTRDQWWLLAAYGGGSFAYSLLISKMANWGAFGWGPRYLVPVLPVIFVAAAIGLVHLWRDMKPAAIAVVALSLVLTLPPAFVNWHLATTTFYGAVDAHARLPYQQIAGWKALAWGLRGARLPVAPDAANDPHRATTGMFPDLLIARLARHSSAGLVCALCVVASATLIATVCLRRIVGRAVHNENLTGG